MSPIITTTLLVFVGLYIITILMELISNHSLKMAIVEMLILAGFIVVLNITTGFPFSSSRQSFGGVSPLVAIGIMFVCSVLGSMANCLVYFKGEFSWRKLLKPLVVSPIIFLPLIGSV